MKKIILVSHLTDDEKETFIEAFYLQWPSDWGKEDIEFPSSPRPWGCPWYYDEDAEIKGDTIEEMAINYFNQIKDDIYQEIKNY